ncbi:MAG: sulfurtransferase [Lentisphaeria bacterium]|nr:sulfurtransferase [Lentisphaeria bacterium]NQZ68571.1 sulfurtransferase [Lentisphaeria bacterium]
MQHSEKFLAIVNDAKAKIKECNCDDIQQLLEVGDQLNLIDCREESEWQRGHIQGAQYMGKGIIERDIEAAFPDMDTEIIFYCGGGFRSALVCEALQRMGYTNVSSMDGGWREWSDKNYPVV